MYGFYLPRKAWNITLDILIYRDFYSILHLSDYSMLALYENSIIILNYIIYPIFGYKVKITRNMRGR